MLSIKIKGSTSVELVQFSCPSCKKDISGPITGIPLVCHTCSELIPDMIDLVDSSDPDARIEYYSEWHNYVSAKTY